MDSLKKIKNLERPKNIYWEQVTRLNVKMAIVTQQQIIDLIKYAEWAEMKLKEAQDKLNVTNKIKDL